MEAHLEVFVDSPFDTARQHAAVNRLQRAVQLLADHLGIVVAQASPHAGHDLHGYACAQNRLQDVCFVRTHVLEAAAGAPGGAAGKADAEKVLSSSTAAASRQRQQQYRQKDCSLLFHIG